MDNGDPIWLYGDEDTVKAKFVGAGSPGEAMVDPKIGIPRDIAWVEILEGEEEGLIARAFYRQIRSRTE